MRPDGSQFERFVTAVHRRMVVLRVLERAGLGVLIGCGVALGLMPVLMWRGLGTMPLVAGCLGLGGLGGLMWGAARRPNRLAAAVEADRQLGLADLLGTSLFLRNVSGELDPLARAVLTTAEARAAGLRPATVIVNRIGARGWGGIALTCGLVLVVGLMTAGDRIAQANSEPREETVASWRDEDAARREQGRLARANRERDTRRVRPLPGGPDEDRTVAAAPDAGTANTAEGGPRDPGGGTSSEGTGAGAAQSAVKASPGQGLSAAAGGDQGGGAGTSSGGIGAATRGISGAGGGTTGGGTEPRRAAPVWAADRWAQDREAALQAVRNGEMPDEYRPLVRDYFERK